MQDTDGTPWIGSTARRSGVVAGPARHVRIHPSRAQRLVTFALLAAAAFAAGTFIALRLL